MGVIRKSLSVSTAGLIDFRSDKERIARSTRKTSKAAKEQLRVQREQLQQARIDAHRQVVEPTPPAAVSSLASGQSHQAEAVSDQLQRLADLQQSGLLNDEEFAAAKTRLLGTATTDHTVDAQSAVKADQAKAHRAASWEAQKAEMREIAERGKAQRAETRARHQEQRAEKAAAREARKNSKSQAREESAGTAGPPSVPQSPPAAWYPDPEDDSQFRYWDGTAWTEHRAPLSGPSDEVS